MRRVSSFLTTLVLAALLLAACGGDENATGVPGTNVPPMTQEPASEMTASPVATDAATTPDQNITPNVPVTGEESPNRLTNLMDYDVWNQNGEQIGEVDDMVLDFDNSNIPYVIVGTGGFLDIGEKDVLVPWNMLELQTAADNTTGGENAFLFTGDEEFYKNAPDTDVNNVLPDMGQPAEEWDADIRSFWSTGVVPEATATQAPEGTASPEASVATATLSANSQGNVQGQEMQGILLASELLGSTIQVYGAAVPGSTEGQDAGTASPDATADPLATATGAAGATGNDMAGVIPTNTMDLTVEDAIVDPAAGTIQYLIVSGGFADGERLLPVPFDQLRWNGVDQTFSLAVNSSALETAPVFVEDQYPDFSTGEWEAEVSSFWNNLGADALVPTLAP